MGQFPDPIHPPPLPTMQLPSTPSPPPALSLTITPRHSTIGLSTPHTSTQICTSIHACQIPPDDDHRAPVDIIVALDVSGSMRGRKLDLCKKTLHLLLRELHDDDRFGLVSFADEAIREIPLEKCTERDEAVRIIDGLETRGFTNLEGAIDEAARELRDVECPNEVRSVFLLTDGLANRGLTDPEEIVRLTERCLEEAAVHTTKKAKRKRLSYESGVAMQHRHHSPPITIHTFGYGYLHDQKLLRNISSASAGGTYYFVDKDSKITSAFGDALGGILSVVAQNVVLTISVPPEVIPLGVTILDVHHDNKIKLDESTYQVTIDDFYAEETRDVLMDVTLATPHSNAADPVVPHVNVFMAYTDTIQKRLISTPTPSIGLISRPSTSTLSPVNPHVAIQWLRIRTTLAVSNAERFARSGDFVNARTIIDDELYNIYWVSCEIHSQDDLLVEQLIADLNALLEGLVDERAYGRYGAMGMEVKMQSHVMQRCSEACGGEKSVYRSSCKSMRVQSFREGEEEGIGTG